MSENKNQNDAQPQEEQNLENNQEQTQQDEQSWQELAGLDPNEFDKPEKLAKSYKEARKGLSEQGQKIKQYEQQINQVVPVLQVINDDPELAKKVREKLTGQSQGNNNQSDTNGTKPQSQQIQQDPNVQELMADRQNEIISDFENEFRVSDMKESEAQKFRQKIREKMSDWGYGAQKVPSINKLRSIMTDAAIAAGFQKPKHESDNESYGFGTPRVYSGPTQSRGIKPDQLTAAQKKAAKGMGLSLEDYAKHLSEINSQ